MYHKIIIYWVPLAHFSFTLPLIRRFFFKPKLLHQYLFERLQKQQLRRILVNISVFNLIDLTKLCSLLATFGNTQETFHHCHNVAVWVIWRCDVGQCQINVETMLCMSTVTFAMLNNVKSTSTLSNSTLILTTLDNLETLNSASSFTTIINVKTTVNMTIQNVEKHKKYCWASKKDDSLINNTCFWLCSIKKRGKHWTYP